MLPGVRRNVRRRARVHGRVISQDERTVADPEGRLMEFEPFFEREYPRLARALYLVTGDRAEAEDLAQEAMVRVYERWEHVRNTDSPAGYLYRTALNLHRSRLRRLAVRARRAVGLRPDPPADPALEAEVRDEVDRALAALPDGQREAVVLVEWVGLSAEEAGRVLGIEPVSVRVRLSRARATLRTAMEDRDDERS
jgi:RNA polymerase sigma-70 factor, ECF subfamily